MFNVKSFTQLKGSGVNFRNSKCLYVVWSKIFVCEGACVLGGVGSILHFFYSIFNASDCMHATIAFDMS